MNSRTYKSEGLVLRQYNLGEADRILSILTPDFGKVRVVAKGVRRPKSKLRGHLDLTNLVHFTAAYGRNLDIVTEAQVGDAHSGFGSDLTRVSQGIYVSELADSFAEERSPGRALYALVKATLQLLVEAPDPWILVRWFEMRLLDVTGFRPDLEQCVECGEGLEPGDHLLDLGAGGVLCPACRRLGVGRKLLVSQNAMRVLRHLQRSIQPIDLGTLNLAESLKNDVEGIMTRYIRSVIERDVRSAEFVKRAAEV